MKCEQTRLKASGSGCFSTRATRRPSRPSRIAVAQPARLPPTMTASYSGELAPLLDPVSFMGTSRLECACDGTNSSYRTIRLELWQASR